MSVLAGNYEQRGTLPLAAAENPVTSGLRALVRHTIGVRLTKEEVGRRQVATPLVKARLGAEAFYEGRRKRDDSLSHFGAAMAATALVEVEDPRRGVVPFDVADEVGGIAETVLPTDLASNPFVSEEKADRVATIRSDTYHAYLDN